MNLNDAAAHDEEWTTRPAVVTGAASGMGAEIARRLARKGAPVLLVDQDAAGLARSAETIKREDGKCVPMALDLCADDAPEKVVTRALESFGALKVLIHAAGIFAQSPFASCPRESLDQQWAINARAPFLLSQAAVPYLESGGVIIFISSISGGHVGWPNAAAYSMSKGALWGLTRALGVELAAKDIRVNTIAPGTTDTPMNSQMLGDPAVKAAIIEGTPMGRIADAEDIAEPVIFLASGAARHVCGTTMIVDGGYSAR